jgi:hypothetical protein
LPHPPSNNSPQQQYIITPNLGMQAPGNVVNSTYIPQQLMPMYNHQILNNAQQQMQAIPPLLQTHPQNVIIRNEYPNTFIQAANPGQLGVQQFYRLAMPGQQSSHQQQLQQASHQQPITVYQIQPQMQQTQQLHSQQLQHQPQQQQSRGSNNYSGGNHHGGGNGGGGGRSRKSNHGNNNWHGNSQQTSQQQQQSQQLVNQQRYQQIMPQNPIYMPQMGGPVYINQNAAITSQSSNNVALPINMIPHQYGLPQPYQRIDANNMNGMITVQGQGIPQNAIMVAPPMGMQQHQMHHPSHQIMGSQPPTSAPVINQGSPSVHFPPNYNVPPPPIQKKMIPSLSSSHYTMQPPPVILSNPSQVCVFFLNLFIVEFLKCCAIFFFSCFSL